MTDTAPTAPEPVTDGLEFVTNGIIRFHFSEGKTVRVRRPFLGELKEIRLALQDAQDELAGLAASVTAEGRDLQAEATALSDRLQAKEVSNEDHAQELAEIRARDRSSAQKMDAAREEQTLGWWALVFSTLALDDVPDAMHYPAWILDPGLPNRCLNHWRSVPSGPG